MWLDSSRRETAGKKHGRLRPQKEATLGRHEHISIKFDRECKPRDAEVGRSEATTRKGKFASISFLVRKKTICRNKKTQTPVAKKEYPGKKQTRKKRERRVIEQAYFSRCR